MNVYMVLTMFGVINLGVSMLLYKVRRYFYDIRYFPSSEYGDHAIFRGFFDQFLKKAVYATWIAVVFSIIALLSVFIASKIGRGGM